MFKQVIGKKDVEAQLLSSATDCAGRGTPDPDMFQQLPSESKKQQPSYALISQNKTIDSKFISVHYLRTNNYI